EIARPELAVDREIEERRFTGVLLQLKPDSDRPDLALLERCFLAHEFAFVRRDMVRRRVIESFHTRLLWGSEQGKRVGLVKGRLDDPKASLVAVRLAAPKPANAR